MHSPSIARLEVVSRGKVRRAKLYYLRELRGKKARIRERRIEGEDLAAVNAAAFAAGLAPDEAEEAEEAEVTGAEDAAEAHEVGAEGDEPIASTEDVPMAAAEPAAGDELSPVGDEA